jgi:hypothetical protein
VKRVTIELGDLTQHNLKQLKVLNRDVFPVAYNEKFYKDLLGAGELCKLGRRARGESIALNEPERFRSSINQLLTANHYSRLETNSIFVD